MLDISVLDSTSIDRGSCPPVQTLLKTIKLLLLLSTVGVPPTQVEYDEKVDVIKDKIDRVESLKNKLDSNVEDVRK